MLGRITLITSSRTVHHNLVYRAICVIFGMEKFERLISSWRIHGERETKTHNNDFVLDHFFPIRGLITKLLLNLKT